MGNLSLCVSALHKVIGNVLWIDRATLEEKEICELPDCLLDDGCVEVRELVNPDIAAASARAFAALKLWRLSSR